MPVSEDHGFAFVHVPRTGGQSVLHRLTAVDGAMTYYARGLWEILLGREDAVWLVAQMRRVYPVNSLSTFCQQHIPALVLRRLVGYRRWASIFTFSLVRNPWDWVVSRYHHQQRERHAIERAEPEKAALLGRCPTFEEFVRLLPINEVPSMIDMLADRRGRTIVDFVGKFETLQEDIDRVGTVLGIGPLGVPHLDATAHAHYREYYNEQTRALVARHYAADIERFGYDF